MVCVCMGYVCGCGGGGGGGEVGRGPGAGEGGGDSLSRRLAAVRGRLRADPDWGEFSSPISSNMAPPPAAQTQRLQLLPARSRAWLIRSRSFFWWKTPQLCLLLVP
jgi:hypothetical protein